MRRTKSEALETREALLDAAEAVFFEKGVSRTSLTDIASAANLTRGAIYWHFADKAALFEAMQERGRLPQEYVSKLVDDAVKADPLDLIREVGVDALRYLEGNERSRRICTIMMLRCEYVGEMSEVLTRLEQADDEMFEVLQAAFQNAEWQGFLHEGFTAETASLAFTSAMCGLMTQWLRGGERFDLVVVGSAMLDAMFRGFARTADRRPQRAADKSRAAELVDAGGS